MQNWMGGGGLEEGSFSSKTSTSIPSSPTVGNASSASEGVIDYHDNVLHHPLHHHLVQHHDTLLHHHHLLLLQLNMLCT